MSDATKPQNRQESQAAQEKPTQDKAAQQRGPRLTRRSLLKSAGAAVAAAGGASLLSSCEIQAPRLPAQVIAPADPNIITSIPSTGLGATELPAAFYQARLGEARTLQYFKPHEARTVEAITARIMPGDPDDPGAREAGVVYYIDGVLASELGYGQPTYREPPYAMGYDEDDPPTQAELDAHYGVIWLPNDQLERYGYQSIVTPRETYRMGLAALDRYANAQFSSNFVDLGESDQDAIVEALANGEAEGFDDPTAEDFFDILREHTIEGMFSDPIYGGNRDMVGWRLVGYPGSQRGYTAREMKTEGHQREPQSLLSLHHYRPGVTTDPNVVLPIQGSQQVAP